MENIELLVETLNYIEENLTENIKNEDIADHLFCSKSTIEKLFKYFNNISIRDYIIRRRMSKAAIDLTDKPEASLLEIALKYGYSSNEAFDRAFFSVWQLTPSEFRKNPSAYELFPRFLLDQALMEDETMSSRKKVDISELYDFIRERKDCYLIVGDIRNMISFNDISNKAGDLAILTALKRMEQSAGDNDIVFRIGGDEFAILTDSTDVSYANKICQEILNQNGDTITFEGQEIPLSLYVKPVLLQYGTNLKYAELFAKLQGELSPEFKSNFVCD